MARDNGIVRKLLMALIYEQLPCVGTAGHADHIGELFDGGFVFTAGDCWTGRSFFVCGS